MHPDDPSTPTHHVTEQSFSVGLAGHFSGDDGTGGHLAASLHYACRMAAQLDSTLGHGLLSAVSVRGTRAIRAHVTWGLGAECLLRASLRPDTTSALSMAATGSSPPPTAHPSETIWRHAHEETLSSAHVDAAVRGVHDRTGARWTALLDADLRAQRLFGDLSSGDLSVVANRCQGVLRGLELTDVHVLALSYATASLIVLPLAHGYRDELVVLLVETVDPSALTGAVAAARLALLVAPPPALTLVPESENTDDHEHVVEDEAPAEDEYEDPLATFVPAGARFAGMLDDREPWRPWFRRKNTG